MDVPTLPYAEYKINNCEACRKNLADGKSEHNCCLKCRNFAKAEAVGQVAVDYWWEDPQIDSLSEEDLLKFYAKKATENLSTQVDRAYALFYFVTHTIAYDKPSQLAIKNPSLEIEKPIPAQTLRKGRGVCRHMADLYNSLLQKCDESNNYVQASTNVTKSSSFAYPLAGTVSGIGNSRRTSMPQTLDPRNDVFFDRYEITLPAEVKVFSPASHRWNRVILEGTAYDSVKCPKLIDPTTGGTMTIVSSNEAGNVDGELTLKKEFNPRAFSMSNYPECFASKFPYGRRTENALPARFVYSEKELPNDSQLSYSAWRELMIPLSARARHAVSLDEITPAKQVTGFNALPNGGLEFKICLCCEHWIFPDGRQFWLRVLERKASAEDNGVFFGPMMKRGDEKEWKYSIPADKLMAYKKPKEDESGALVLLVETEGFGEDKSPKVITKEKIQGKHVGLIQWRIWPTKEVTEDESEAEMQARRRENIVKLRDGGRNSRPAAIVDTDAIPTERKLTTRQNSLGDLGKPKKQNNNS